MAAIRAQILLLIPLSLLLIGCCSLIPPKPGGNDSIFSGAPIVTIAANTTSGSAPFSPTFSYTCIDPTGDLDYCELRSDGVAFAKFTPPPYPNVTAPIFNSTGEHIIELFAIDKQGRTASKKIIFTVYNSAPIVNLSTEKPEGRVPFYPLFSYLCYDPEGELASCELKIDGKTFANASSQNELFPENFTYPEFYNDAARHPGVHTMEIVGTDKAGLTSSKQINYTITNVIDVYVHEFPGDVDPTFAGALREGFAYWEKRNGVIFKETDKLGSDTVFVDWIKEYSDRQVGLAVRGDTANIGLGDSYCYGKYRAYTYNAVRDVATHELGHIVGYPHTDNPDDIMYPIAQSLKYQIDVDEEKVLPEGWMTYFGHCSRRNTTQYSFEVTSDKPMDFYLLTSSDEYENARKGRYFSYNRACYAEGEYSFRKTCTVTKENVLFIRDANLQSGAARVRIKMREL